MAPKTTRARKSIKKKANFAQVIKSWKKASDAVKDGDLFAHTLKAQLEKDGLLCTAASGEGQLSDKAIKNTTVSAEALLKKDLMARSGLTAAAAQAKIEKLALKPVVVAERLEGVDDPAEWLDLLLKGSPS